MKRIKVEKVFIKYFDLFGFLVDHLNSITSFRRQLFSIKPSLHPHSKYPFRISNVGHFGLLNFFSSFSIGQALKSLITTQSPSMSGTSIFNLFIWDDSKWRTENGSDNFFFFEFSFGLSFLLLGYPIRSSDEYFPKSWKIEGITTKQKLELIDEQKKNTLLHSKNSDAIYLIEVSKFYCGFKMIQIGNNTSKNRIFPLSAIDFFGSLSTFIKKDHNPSK
jgi:hypothetical protein